MSNLDLILGIVVGLLMLVFGIIGIVKQKRNKTSKSKKQNFFEKIGETGDPVHFSNTPKQKKKSWWFQNHHWRGPLSSPMI